MSFGSQETPKVTVDGGISHGVTTGWSMNDKWKRSRSCAWQGVMWRLRLSSTCLTRSVENPSSHLSRVLSKNSKCQCKWHTTCHNVAAVKSQPYIRSPACLKLKGIRPRGWKVELRKLANIVCPDLKTAIYLTSKRTMSINVNSTTPMRTGFLKDTKEFPVFISWYMHRCRLIQS